MKKVACFLFFIGVALPYGYVCLIHSALRFGYLVSAAIAAVVLGWITLVSYRKDKSARWKKAAAKAEAERIARKKAEEEARKKAEAERIAREKAEEEARIAREKAAHEAAIAQFNASIRQQLADLEAAFQKAQEDEAGVIATLKAL